MKKKRIANRKAIRNMGLGKLIFDGTKVLAKYGVPSHDNMTAQNTLKTNTGLFQKKIRILLDWVAFVVPLGTNIYGLLGISQNEFIHDLKGALGYKTQSVCGHIKIFQNAAKENMGIYVEMSGKGCREYEGYMENKLWMWDILIAEVTSLGGKFNRIDVAIDDTGKYLDFQKIEQKIHRGMVRSRFKECRILDSINLGDGRGTGKTIYFGSASSRFMVRMYDKREQMYFKVDKLDIKISKLTDDCQREKDATKKQGLATLLQKLKDERMQCSGIPDHWIRVELQMRHERANDFAKIYAASKDIDYIVNGVLRNYIVFVDATADSNKARWPVSRFWNDFLDHAQKIKITLEKAVKTIKDVYEWVYKQVAPSLALLSMDKEGNISDLSTVVNMILNNVYRVDKKKLSLITG